MKLSKIIDVFKNLKKHKFWGSKTDRVFIVLLLLLLGGWNYILKTAYFEVLTDNYSYVTGKLSVLISSIFGQPILFNPNLNTLTWSNTIIFQIIPGTLFLLMLCLLILVFVYSRNWLINIGFLLFFIVFLLVRSILINFTLLYFMGTNYSILIDMLDSLRYLPMLFVVSYFIRNIGKFKAVNTTVNGLLSANLIISLEKLLYFLVLLSPLPRIIIVLINDFVLVFWTNLILFISQYILSSFDLQTTIIDNVIHWGHNWIQLGQGCLGIGMLTIIFILLFSTRSKIENKILYFCLTVPVFTILNSLRIILLLLYLKNGWNSVWTAQEMHDNANVLFYLIGFLLFIIYFFWFQDVKLDFRGTKK